MKRKFSRIFGVGLALVLIVALAVPMGVQARTLEWGEEDLPTVKETFASGKTVNPGTDIMDLAVGNDGKTIYAVVQAQTAPLHPPAVSASDNTGQELWRTTNGGETWSSRSPTSGNASSITHVAVAPDDVAVVVAAGTVSGVNWVWISLEKGESGTWSGNTVAASLNGTITDIVISKERDETRWIAVSSNGTGPCLAVAKAEAFAGWDTAGSTDGSDNWTGWVNANAAAGVLAVAFSPWFANDNALLALTVSGTVTYIQGAEVDDTIGDSLWNASTPTTSFGTDYPVTVATSNSTAGQLALPDTFFGTDAAERIIYVGSNLGTYRMDDNVATRIKSGNLPFVAYNSEANKLLAGYASTGRVDMSENPDAGSPTFTRPRSMKSPSGQAVSGVGWLDETMVCTTTSTTATADDQSAFSISTDARSWNQLSLIDADLEGITDMVVSEDGSVIYVASISSAATDYSIWRFTDRWERVLCDELDSDADGVIVRLAPGMPEVVFVGQIGTREVRRSTDSGETWAQSRADIDMVDMAVKDDKVVFAVSSGGYVSTSKDGGRSFAKYVKSNASPGQAIIAPNGDLLIVGDCATTARLTVAVSTDDGTSFSRMAEHTGLTSSDYPMLVAADTDYATNNIIYIAHNDDSETYILRWEIGGGLERWDAIASLDYPLDDGNVIYGMVAHEGTLYVSSNISGGSNFASSANPTAKRTSVQWGGGTGTDAEAGSVDFDLSPGSLRVSSGSAQLWAIDTTDTDGKGNRLWSYTDIVAKVAAPILTSPATGHKVVVDPVTQQVNPVRFIWEEINPDVSYELRIGSNDAVSKHTVTYPQSATENLAVTDGASSSSGGTYPLTPGETFYWKVRVAQPTVGPWSEIRSFTIEKAKPAVAEAPVITVEPPVITVTPPAVTVTPPAVTVTPPEVTVQVAPMLPAWMLWIIIGIGVFLVIALIILIVRTRRVV